MRKFLLSTACIMISVLALAQEFPYGKMLKMTEQELIEAKFKYNDDYNQWVLQKLNGLQVASNILGALSGTSADSKPHKDDYVVTIQRGETEVASIDVRFYDDEIFHTIMTFANDKGENLLETTSGALNKVQFNYDGYSFVLQYKKIGSSIVTTQTTAKAKTIDDSYNEYHFTFYTGVEAVSPYLTKQAEKEAKRAEKGKKERSAASLM